MNLVIVLLLFASIGTLFTSSTKGRLSNSIVNFFLMSLLAIKDYGVEPTWLWILFLILAIVNAVFVMVYTTLYLEENSGKKITKINDRDKFLNDIKRKYGS